MMELNATSGSSNRSAVDPNAQSAALAEARSRATRDALSNAETAAAGRRENLERARAAFEAAVGANTRISIARRPDALAFVYRAIDNDTGEVVREWPPADFARFMRDALGDAQATTGVLFSEES